MYGFPQNVSSSTRRHTSCYTTPLSSIFNHLFGKMAEEKKAKKKSQKSESSETSPDYMIKPEPITPKLDTSKYIYTYLSSLTLLDGPCYSRITINCTLDLLTIPQFPRGPPL